MATLNPCTPEELEIRENFKRDYKLSCPVLDDNDIFAKSLVVGNLQNEWPEYLEMSKRHEDINEYRKTVRNKITSFISAVKGFENAPLQEYKYPDIKAPRSYLNDENVGKRLLSIDLVKGNYQSLKYLGTQYVLDTDSYEDLIKRFTNEKCLISSKFFRQMVFGLLRPDLQASVQRNMLGSLIETVKKSFPKFELVGLSNDEAVLRIENDSQLDEVAKVLQASNTNVLYRLTLFRIEKIPNTYEDPWYVKYYLNQAADKPQKRLMAVHVRYLMQVYNFIEGNENDEKDFWWRERGRLCKLLEPERFGVSK